MSAVEQLITDNLDVWASAVKTKSSVGRGSSKKLDLYGIRKLRELILELAVSGLLVTQDDREEPASVLIEKISCERQRLTDEGSLKTKAKDGIADIEMYISKQKGWGYLRLGNLAKFIDYRGKTPKKITEGVPLITAKNIKSGYISREPAEFISEEDYVEWMTRGFPKVNDVLFTTEAPLGNVALIDIHERFALAQRSICFQLHEPLVAPFLVYLIMSNTFQAQLKDNATGMTASGIKASKLKEIPIPLPPLGEQHRIVAKVNELMALCDQLEQQQENSISAHQTLVENLLAALTNAGEKGEFNQAWARIAEHFDTLFTTEHSIDQLKQTILQLAVMGKLVPQDPNDESASVLLEKIAAEKAQLVKDKKIKKQKALPEIGEDEKPFELPEGWEWRRIAEFGVVGTGATPSRTNTEYFQPADVNWVTSGETGSDFVFETKEKVSYKAIAETNVSIYPEGTLVIAMYGQGKTRGQITELMVPAGTNQACAAIQLIQESEAHRKYTKLYFQKAYDELRSLSAGGAQPNLNVGKISLTVLPIPPHEEQKRIVDKVGELMALCDSLKNCISESQTTQLHLADAMAEQALN